MLESCSRFTSWRKDLMKFLKSVWFPSKVMPMLAVETACWKLVLGCGRRLCCAIPLREGFEWSAWRLRNCPPSPHVHYLLSLGLQSPTERACLKYNSNIPKRHWSSAGDFFSFSSWVSTIPLMRVRFRLMFARWRLRVSNISVDIVAMKVCECGNESKLW